MRTPEIPAVSANAGESIDAGRENMKMRMARDRLVMIGILRNVGRPMTGSEIDKIAKFAKGRAHYVAARSLFGYFNMKDVGEDNMNHYISLKAGL